MTYAIKVIDADGSFSFVKEFDPDVRGEAPYPTGELVTTNEKAEALQFLSFRDAYEFILQQSTVTPLRPDGKPNRPLTKFNLEIGRVRFGADNTV